MTTTEPLRSAAPEVQQHGGVVILAGLALHDARRLIGRGIWEAERQDGIRPHRRLEILLAAIDVAMSEGGLHDVATPLARPRSIPVPQRIGTAEAARILAISARQTQRIARSLDGFRSPSGSWIFDRAAVESFAYERRTAA